MKKSRKLLGLIFTMLIVISSCTNKENRINEKDFNQLISGQTTKKIAYQIENDNKTYYRITSLDKKKIYNIGNGNTATSFAWSPDGEKVAYVNDGDVQSGLRIFSLITNHDDESGGITSPFLPHFKNMSWKEKIIVFSGQEQNADYDIFFFYPANTSGIANKYSLAIKHRRTSPSFSPNTMKIAYYSSSKLSGDGKINKSDCYSYFDNMKGRSGEQYDIYCGDEYAPWEQFSPVWEKTGNRFLTYSNVSGVKRILLFDTSNNTFKDLGSGQEPDWSPDGQEFVFSKDSQLNIMNEKGEMRNLRISGFAPKWSPDGKFIAFADYSSDGWGIFITDPKGSFRYHLDQFNGYVNYIFWEP